MLQVRKLNFVPIMVYSSTPYVGMLLLRYTNTVCRGSLAICYDIYYVHGTHGTPLDLLLLYVVTSRRREAVIAPLDANWLKVSKATFFY